MNPSLPEHRSVVSLLRRHAAERPERTAVTFVHDHDASDGHTSLTYRQLDTEARRVGSWLGRRCETGDRVMLLHPPGLGFVSAFLGCLYAGVVAVPSPAPGRFQHQRRRVGGIARDAGARVALTDASQLSEVEEWARGSGVDLEVAASEGDDVDGAREWRDPGADAETVALLQYTSGSTGDPKGVVVDHGNLLHNVDGLRSALGLEESTGFGGWIPLYHDMGLMGQLLPGLFLGSECVLMSPMAFLKRPHHWLSLISRHGVGYSAAPNFAYELCTRRVTDAQLAGVDLSGWRFAANGSEPIQGSTLRDFAARFAGCGFRSTALAPCYGMAESTVYVSGLAGREPVIRGVDAAALEKNELRDAEPDGLRRELVGCGDASDHEVRVVEPGTGRELPEDTVGEVWLRGPSVARGYWGREDATDETFGAHTADGDGPFLRTGDLGALRDGELYITGRLKDMLIVHGRNLYPHDVEHELRLHHPQLATLSGAVFGVLEPDEELVVVHEVRGRFDAAQYRELADGLEHTVSREFGTAPAGTVLLRPGTVPKTTSGKVQRAEARRLFLAGLLNPVHQQLSSRLADIAGPGREGAPE